MNWASPLERVSWRIYRYLTKKFLFRQLFFRKEFAEEFLPRLCPKWAAFLSGAMGFQGGFPLWAFSHRHLGLPTSVWMWLSSGSDSNCVVFVSPKFYFPSTPVTVCGNRRNILNSICENSREGNCRKVPQGGGTSHVLSVRKITSHLKRLRAVLDPFLKRGKKPPKFFGSSSHRLGE